MKYFSFLILVASLFVVACSSDDDPMDPMGSGCETEGLTYNNDIATIINGSCAIIGCHVDGGDAPFGLEDFAEVSEAVSFGRIIGAINRQDGFAAMPPSGSIDACSIDQITAWINDGAPE